MQKAIPRKGGLEIELDIKLSPQQIKQIASCISLKDVQDYINTHQTEYEQYLKTEEKEQALKNHKFFYGSFAFETIIRRNEKIEIVLC